VVRTLERVVSLVVLLRAGAFDLDWYQRQRGHHGSRGRFPSVRVPWAAHYVWRGRRAGLSPHPLFEAEWAFPRDWRDSGPDPVARLLRGRPRFPISSHPLCDARSWIDTHPEAVDHRWGWFGHFLTVVSAPGGGSTPLPLPAWATRRTVPEPTVADARVLLGDRLLRWQEDEARRRAPRVSRTFDAAAGRRVVDRYRDAALPAEVPGRPLVSVVLPVRDRAGTVGAAVRSVLAQTLSDWELLVVDDGSVDGTVDAVRTAAAGDGRVITVTGNGRGVSAARNRGAEHARGRYLAWLDSDNEWQPQYLRTVLAAMEDNGWQAAYAVVEGVGQSDGRAGLRPGAAVRSRFRGFDPGPAPGDQLPYLEVANHVDLNVFVARRELVDGVGGFDESLRRTVDYDLVWRIARTHELHHVPVIGVRYTEQERSDRITVRERASWREVVKNRHLIDWDALAAGADDRDPELLSVLIAGGTDWRGAWASARSVLEEDEEGSGGPVEVVVTDDATARGSSLVLACLPFLDRRVRLRRTPVRVHRALATNLALDASRGARVVILAAGAEVCPGWRPLVDRIRPGEPAVPVTLDVDGTVAAAGEVFTGEHVLPAKFLAGFTARDAERLGDVVEVDLPDGAAAAFRAVDLIGIRGLDCLYVDGRELPDAVLRLSDRGRVHLVPRSRVRLLDRPEDTDGSARELFAQRWRERSPSAVGAVRLWRAAGFEVRSWDSADDGDLADDGTVPVVPVPRLDRIPPSGTGPGGVPRLRWAVKIAAPSGRAALRWGDLHFAQALADALERLGQEVGIDHRDAFDRPTGRFDDVVLTIRGLRPVPVRDDAPGQVRLLWVISHPEMVTAEEIASYDRAFAASLTWGEGAGRDRWGNPVRPLLQATDPERFHPGAAAADSGEPVLFVGNSRGVFRPVVSAVVSAGIEVGIYGGRWAEFLGAEAVRAEHVPNDRLAALYRAAGVVLNDHWDDMRERGFLSNRLFDAAACGARIISDDVPGMGDVFADLVRGYRDEGELVELVRSGPEGFPSEERRLAVAERIRRDHSFDARAEQLLAAAVEMRRGNRSG
jgi:glycosyltransferase involved in cell wall biosynthesis